MKPWYEKLFENYAEGYEREPFTRGTMGECDFIEKELNYNKSLKILDVGCGTGRHTIELTKRGYAVTGVDLSEAQLRKARQKAGAEKQKIEFLQCDARNLPFRDEFDAAIMLCEGAFPLMETDEMNFAILQSVTRALKTPAKFVFTTLSGLYRLFREHPRAERQQGEATGRESFDIMTMRSRDFFAFTDDDGQRHEIVVSERYYLPVEIRWLLKSLGYRNIEIFGATLGAFSREEPLTPDHFEMLVVAEK
ncbi:MAG: class I SAM-dependent methyltransferase [Limnochordia bacterium]|jgi:SAM-dependent methyltransferase